MDDVTKGVLDAVKRMVSNGVVSQEIAEKYFPQIIESDDERIRKEITAFFKNFAEHGTWKAIPDVTKWINWLEKEGEQDAITFNGAHIIDSALNDYCCIQYGALHKENGGVLSFARLQHLAMDIYGWCKKQGEQKVIVPKFRVGDKVRLKGSCGWYNVTEIRGNEYYLTSNDVVPCLLPICEQDNWEAKQNPAWSEEDEVGLADALWAIEQARTIAKDENDMGNLWYAERWIKRVKERLANE